MGHITFLDKPNQEIFFLSPTDEVETEKIILSLDSKNIYGVSVDLLKYLAKHVSPILSDLFNESMSTIPRSQETGSDNSSI